MEAVIKSAKRIGRMKARIVAALDSLPMGRGRSTQPGFAAHEGEQPLAPAIAAAHLKSFNLSGPAANAGRHASGQLKERRAWPPARAAQR